MAFGQQSGPPASHTQIRELTELLERAGYNGFKDARGPMGFSQRQAGGKFTSEEADEYITSMQEAEHDAAPEPPPAPTAKKVARPRVTAEARPRPKPTTAKPAGVSLAEVSDADLASELQRRGWVVMEP